jgi:acetyltransferase-like isoleucine patch superfamily enzyme
MRNIKEAKHIVAYGLQQYFFEHYKKIRSSLKITHAYDELSPLKPLDGIEIVPSLDDIKDLDGVFILICRYDEGETKKIARKLESLGVPYDHLAFHIEQSIPIHFFRAMDKLSYVDHQNNQLSLSEAASGNVTIGFRGKNSKVRIGSITATQNLSIVASGDNCELTIGDATTFVKCYVEIGAYGLIQIGSDCMFSYDIALHQSDQHLIFDMTSRKRINKSKNITIGNQVWVGRHSMILGGFKIGDGSVIGARTTSSSTFGKNQIVAGSPAKIIRSNVMWSRDLVSLTASDDFDDCEDKSALKYITDDSP